MKVLLINPSMGGYYVGSVVSSAITRSPPLNLALLAGALLLDGHEVEVWDLEVDLDLDVKRKISAFNPDMVGLTARSPLYRASCELAQLVKSTLDESLVVLGGVHASTMPKESLEEPAIDCVVVGEGEAAIRALAKGMDLSTIAGVVTRTTSVPPPALVEDLDTLPLPAWHLFDLSKYMTSSLVARQVPVADLESSRGCRAQCVYCTKGVFGSAWRVKSPERMVTEVAHAKSAGFKSFNLVDDSFTTITSKAIAICQALIDAELDMPWTCTNGIRVGNVSEEFFRIARQAGCWLVAFGFESGSNEILKRIRKGATVAQGARATAWARKYDFTLLGYFMVGLPGETYATAKETAEFAASLDVDYAKFSITMPLPGTPLYENWGKYMKEGHDWDFSIHSAKKAIFEHPEFTDNELQGMASHAYRAFYLRPDYLKRRLTRSIRSGQIVRESKIAFKLAKSALVKTR